MHHIAFFPDMKFIYPVLLFFAEMLLPLISLVNPKIRKWYVAQKSFKSSFTSPIDKTRAYIWIHCASSGEFEQALPLIHALKSRRKELRFAVSFFSVSGYDLYRNSNLADTFFNFPLDTKRNIATLIHLLQPRGVIFIRSELWLNTLLILKEQNIPVFLVNARNVMSDSVFRKKYDNYCKQLFTTVFYTDKYGTTKWDKALENIKKLFQSAVLEDFTNDKFCIMVGSSWNTEEAYAARFLKEYPDLKYIAFVLAPHEWDEDRLQTNFDFDRVQFFSKYEDSKRRNVLFIDTKGILKYAYRYADLAFIGGGFDKTLHNALEAVVYEIPVLAGPNHQKFEEVADLIQQQRIVEINSYEDFKHEVIAQMEMQKSHFLNKQDSVDEMNAQKKYASIKITEAIVKQIRWEFHN